MTRDLAAAAEARAMLSCPWYLGTGTCRTGCWDEPRCQTDAPDGGWETHLTGTTLALPQGYGCAPEEWVTIRPCQYTPSSCSSCYGSC